MDDKVASLYFLFSNALFVDLGGERRMDPMDGGED